MGKIVRFEDLKCWQAARGLVSEVYKVCEQDRLANDFDFKRQIRRAALSCMNNIAEGFGRFSSREFIRFLEMSQSSATEIQSMLYVLEDLQYMTSENIATVRSKTEDTKALTLAFIRYLRSRSEKELTNEAK